MRQGITEAGQLAFRFFVGCRRGYTVMQANFNLPPTRVAKVCKLLHQSFVVLLRRIKIGVIEPLPFGVPVFRKVARILAAPSLQPLLLDIARSISRLEVSYTARLEMISNRDDQMHRAMRRPTGHSLPGVTGKTLRGVLQLYSKRATYPVLAIHRHIRVYWLEC